MPVATIVGAIIAIAGTVISAAISSSDSAEAQNEGRALAERKRNDDIAYRRSQERLDNLRLKQRKTEARMQSRAEKERLKQRKKEFAFTERETFFNKQMGMLNSSETMRSNFVNTLFKRRAA